MLSVVCQAAFWTLTWLEEDNPEGSQAGDVAAPVDDIEVLKVGQQGSHHRHQQNDHCRVDAVDSTHWSIAPIRPAEPHAAFSVGNQSSSRDHNTKVYAVHSADTLHILTQLFISHQSPFTAKVCFSGTRINALLVLLVVVMASGIFVTSSGSSARNYQSSVVAHYFAKCFQCSQLWQDQMLAGCCTHCSHGHCRHMSR